jgi:hypothetical protein
MRLLSLYLPGHARRWSVVRAAFYGAAVGAVASVFKLAAPWGEPHAAMAIVRECATAAFGFAALCAAAAALRNVIARRLIWPELP